MNKFRSLSFGLIGAGMLATPVVASEHYASHRHSDRRAIAEEMYRSGGQTFAVSPDGRAMAGRPSQETATSCDVGDNPFIC